jgi:ribosome-binding protein aMBF1 (putative translation factor)
MDQSEIIKLRKEVCARISRALMLQGMSQRELANIWQRPESQVSSILNGKVDMQLSTLLEIEKLLNIELIRKDKNFTN